MRSASAAAGHVEGVTAGNAVLSGVVACRHAVTRVMRVKREQNGVVVTPPRRRDFLCHGELPCERNLIFDMSRHSRRADAPELAPVVSRLAAAQVSIMVSRLAAAQVSMMVSRLAAAQASMKASRQYLGHGSAVLVRPPRRTVPACHGPSAVQMSKGRTDLTFRCAQSR
jgi:hypothetical protein